MTIEHLEKVDVSVQDQSTQDLSLFLGETLAADATINTNTSLNDETVELSFPTTTPTAGDFLCFKEGSAFLQVEITIVAALGGDDFDCTVDTPLDFAFTTAADVTLQNCNMNVNGLITPVEFSASPSGLDVGEQWDITRMIVSLTHGSSGDDGLFGSLPALANGTYFRIENGVKKNLFNATENANFADQGFDVSYPTRSGGQGTFGTRSRITFSGRDKRGVTLRLKAKDGEKFLGKVRDDLSTLSRFRVTVQGHVVEP